MEQYHDMLIHILEHGEERPDRTGTGTIGVFGYQNRYDLSEGFPLVTTKFVPLRVIFEELNWFLKGSTDLADLLDKNVNIWNADAYRWYLRNAKGTDRGFDFESFIKKMSTDRKFATRNGNLGPIYGKQWRSWSSDNEFEECGMGSSHLIPKQIDQIANVIESIKNDPYGRRHIVNAWNVADLDKMALPPCHVMFQFYVSTDGKLSCQLYQRSADAFLGVPFNIASYALLIHMIAKVTGLKVGEFIHTFGDLHIYKNHIKQVEEQLLREPHPLPTLRMPRGEVTDIDSFEWKDFDLLDYVYDPAIKGKVSVGK